MTQDKGFHMKLRNCEWYVRLSAVEVHWTIYLQEWVLVFLLKLVRTEELDTTGCLFRIETILVTLKEFENILNNDSLEINLFFVIKVLRFQLNLFTNQKVCFAERGGYSPTTCQHWHLG